MVKERKKIGRGILSFILMLTLIAPQLLPFGPIVTKAYAAGNTAESNLESGEEVVLSLSTAEIVAVIARVAGSEAVEQMEAASKNGQDNMTGLVSENLVNTEIFVEASEAVQAKDQLNNEVAVKEALPQVSSGNYSIDQETQSFLNGLTYPENSKTIEKNLLETLQGTWFIKAFSGSGYQAVAMLNPNTLEIQVSLINNSSEEIGFRLEVKDPEGKIVEATEVTAFVQKAVAKTLTPEEFALYQTQENTSVEVISALANSDSAKETKVSGVPVDENAAALPSKDNALTVPEDQTEPINSKETMTSASVQASLVEVGAVVVEDENISAESGFSVPSRAYFAGTFGGITPFSLNHTVEFLIGTSTYNGPVSVSAGSTIAKEDAPPYEKWPENATSFNGWFLDGATTPFDFTTPVTENIRLYAYFSNGFTITYKNESGQIIDTKLVELGEQIPETSQIVSPPSGKLLVYWYEEGTSELQPFIFGTTATKDLTLLPYFSNEFYTIFISEGSQVSPGTVTSGGMAIKPSDPTREGYQFSHWSTTKDGATYNFNTPVTENLRLYAVWTAKDVDYRVVYWVERENFIGDPGMDVQNYNYAYSDYMVSEAGSEVSLTASQTDSRIATLIEADKLNPLRYSTFSHSDKVNIAGNGTSTVNVYYKRIEYTFNFHISDDYLGTAEDPTKLISGGVTYNAVSEVPSLTVRGKFQQDVSDLWPEVVKSSSIAGSNHNGWTPPSAITSSGWVTKRYLVTEGMIHQTDPRGSTVYKLTDRWVSSKDTFTVEYWLESIDGTGEKFTTDRERTFLRKDSYTQEIVTSSNLSPKELDGFTKNANWASGSQGAGATQKFYYNRVTSSLSFDSKGGSPVGSHILMYEMPLAAYKPADPTRDDYYFAGWYRDAEYNEPFDFSTATMPKDGLVLYARWESSAFTVSYYDRLGGGTVIKTQGYAPGEFVTYSADLYQIGQSVEGYGQFLGWKWIIPGTSFFTDYSVDIPVYQDLALYATWKTSGLTVSYDKGAATGTPPTDSNVYDIGRSVALKLPTNLTPPTGQVFYGWLPEGSESSQLYYPRNLFEIPGNTKFIPYYGAAKDAFKVDFDSGYDGSTEELISWYVPQNSTVYLLDAVFTRPNAKLLGWSEIKGSSTVQYELGELTKIDSDKTLYAVWSINAYNVYFQADDEKGELLDRGKYTAKVEYRDIPSESDWSTAITEGVPEVKAKDGFYFTGWSPAIPDAASKITSDKTFVAQFEKQAEIVLTAGSATKAYDGTPLMNDEIIATGLDSKLYTVKGSMTPGSTATNASTVENVIDSYQIIRNSDGREVTEQFKIDLQTGELLITPCRVTITAEDKNKTYGEVDPELTAILSNVPAEGDSINYSVSRVSGEDVGEYDITVDVTENNNYSVDCEKATFTINRATGQMTASAENVNAVYDGEVKAIAVNVAGEKDGYTVTYSTEENGPFIATQPVKVNVADSGEIYYEVSHPNHNTVKGSAIVSIAQRDITLTADDAGKVYGAQDPNLTATLGNVPSKGDAVNYRLTREVGDNVGIYGIKVTAENNPNYIVAIKDGSFTITKSTGLLSASANDVNVTYDGEEKGIEVSVTGVAEGYTVSYAANANGPFIATQPKKINVAESGKIFYEVSHPNHESVKGAATVTIAPRDISINVNNTSKLFEELDPVLTASISNLPAKGDLVNYTLTREPGENVGVYTITVNAANNPNYAVKTNNGTLTIGKNNSTLRATANDVNAVYDGETKGITVNVTSVAGAYTVAYSTDESGPFVGTQPNMVNVTDSGKIYYEVSHPNYETVKGSAMVSIAQREVIVTADNKNKIFGENDPELTVNIDNVPINGAALNYDLTRELGVNVGTYNIIVKAENNPNYLVTTKDGTLTISKKSGEMVATASNLSVDYDGEAKGINVSVTGVSDGYMLTYAADQNGPFVETQPVKINVIDSGKIYYEVKHQNHETVKGSATVTIKERPVSIAAENKSKVFGELDPILEGTLNNAPANGVAVNYTVSREIGENVGTYGIIITPGNNPNYLVTTSAGVFTIEKMTGQMTATAADVNAVYDGEEKGITVAVGGVTGGFTIAYSNSSTGPFSESQPRKVNVADSGMIYYEVTHPNHEALIGSATVDIAQRNVSVKADDIKKPYDKGNLVSVSVGASASDGGHGLLSGNTVEAVATGSGTIMGEYPIVIQTVKILNGTTDVSKNYNISEINGTLTIGKIVLRINVLDTSKPYGTADPVKYRMKLLGIDGSFMPGDTLNNLQTYRFVRVPGESMGDYEVRVEIDNPWYEVICEPGILSITKGGLG